MTIRLSICIPTFNRAAFIEETIESVLSQNMDGVEIVVSDNCSQDDTEKIVHQLQQKFSRITYFRWEANKGADLNYLKAVEIARGEYCWLLGSDDALIPGAVSRVISEIKQGYDIYLCNRIDCSYSLQPFKKFNWLNKSADKVFDFRQREDIVDYFKSARALGAVFSYLSSIIVNRSSWNSVDYDSTMTGTAYSHAYILLALVADGAKLKYVHDALVMNRMGNDSFAQDGELQRFLLDIDGYLKLASKLFVDEEVRSIFLNIMTHEHPWYRLAKIKYFNKDKWTIVQDRLYPFGYSNRSFIAIKLIGSTPYLIKIMRILKRVYESTSTWLQKWFAKI